MDSDCVKSNIESDLLLFESGVNLNEFDDIHHLPDDSNVNNLADGFCSDLSSFDDIFLQHDESSSNRNDDGKGFVSYSDLAIVKRGLVMENSHQTMDISIFDVKQQMAMMKDNSLYVEFTTQLNRSFSSSSISSPVLIHDIKPLTSLHPDDNLSCQIADHKNLFYDQGANVNSKYTSRRRNDGICHKKTKITKGQWTLEEDR